MSEVLEIYDVSTEAIEVITQGPQGPPGSGGGGGGGSGTVTSVALAGTGLSITGSPVTTSGTITANVAYGTTAGTACQGNDTRIVNILKTGSTAGSNSGGSGGSINLSGGNADATWGNGGTAGSINLSGGNAFYDPNDGHAGTSGGSIDLSGGYGGSGGSINLRGGQFGDLSNTSGNGGSIDLSGGAADGAYGGSITSTGGSQSGGVGGSINLSGGSLGAGGSITAIGTTEPSGSLNMSASSSGYGGSISTNGGINGSGGSINLSDGGGSIDTRGTGSIEFGIAGTRTTLTGTATANRAISMPDAAGTLALTSDITKTAVGLGNVTNNAQTQAAIVPNTAPSAGQLLVGNAGGTAYAPASVSGDATLASTGALTVANNAVTNAKLAQIATSTIKGRATSGTGNVEDLSSAQVLTILGLLGAIKDMKIVSPSSDVTATSSTTLSNVTGMSFSVAANTTYLILTNLQMSVGAGGYNCEISFPSILNNGTTASGFGIQLPGSNTVAGLSTTTATTVKVSNRGAAQTTPSFSILLVRTDSTGGTANFQWAQNASNAAASTLSSNTRALIVPLTT